jgi:hypothetical protein
MIGLQEKACYDMIWLYNLLVGHYF